MRLTANAASENSVIFQEDPIPEMPSILSISYNFSVSTEISLIWSSKAIRKENQWKLQFMGI